MDYIRYGEERGFHLRPTCASRDKWWDLGKRKPFPILWAMVHHERHIVFFNPFQVQVDHNLFELQWKSKHDPKLLAALLNSTFYCLLREVTGRITLGEGALKTEGVDIRQFPLLKPTILTPLQRRKLLSAFKQMCRRKILPIFDEVKQPDRQQLDDVVLEVIGFTNRKEREQIRQQLYEAVTSLVRERIYRAASVQPKGRSAVKASVEQLAQEIILSDFPLSARKNFPDDFVPKTAKGQWIDLPTGDVRLMEGNLFEPNKVTIGEQEFKFDSPFKAQFVAIAAQLGLRRVFVPDDDKVLQKVLSDYAKYVLEMERRVNEAVQNSAVGKARKALKAELMRQLKLVPRK